MNNYIRHGVLTLDEVIPEILVNWSAPNHLKKKLEVKGHKVGISSLRLVTFARSYRDHGRIKCAKCGLIASFFSIDSFHAVSLNSSTHLNLYGTRTVDGIEEWILFTHDHILARGLGGADDLENTQVMCSVCNSKKGTIEGKLVEKLRKEKAELLKSQKNE